MSATFGWSQTTGSSGSEATTDLGISGNLFNFKRSDDPTPGNYASHPISAGDKSYEVWLRAKFTGTFNKINSVLYKFFLINGEHLRFVKTMATLSKQAIAVQLQRLSERTLFISEATVRSA